MFKQTLLGLLTLPAGLVLMGIWEGTAILVGRDCLLYSCSGLLILMVFLRLRWVLAAFANARARLRNPPCFLLLRSETAPDAQDAPGHVGHAEIDDHGGLGLAEFDGHSYLCNIVNALNRLGCVIAFKPLGRHNRNVRVMAVVVSASDTEWRDDLAILADCCTIVMVPGCSTSVLDELRLLSSRGWYERAIIVMPPEQREEFRDVSLNPARASNRIGALKAWRVAAEALLRDGIRLPVSGESQGIAYVPNNDLSARESRRLPVPSQDPGDMALTQVFAELVSAVQAPACTYRDAMRRLVASRRLRRQIAARPE